MLLLKVALGLVRINGFWVMCGCGGLGVPLLGVCFGLCFGFGLFLFGCWVVGLGVFVH
jgi:hypothetical protein